MAVAQNAPANRGLIRRGPTDHPEPQAPLLIFNMVALDTKGAPADGLKGTDLRIYDDGELMSAAMSAAFCRPLQSGLETAALGPEEFSNRPVRGDSQTILVLLDLLNQDLTERGLGYGTLYPVHAFPFAGSPHPLRIGPPKFRGCWIGPCTM